MWIKESAIVFREGIDFLSTILFIIPVCFFVPLAIKSGENLIQIASIASYIKVFYEFPSINSNKDKMLWELTNSYCNYAIVDHGKESRLYFAYNSEYTILSMFSTIIYGFRATLSIANTNMNMDRSAIILHTDPYPHGDRSCVRQPFDRTDGCSSISQVPCDPWESRRIPDRNAELGSLRRTRPWTPACSAPPDGCPMR